MIEKTINIFTNCMRDIVSINEDCVLFGDKQGNLVCFDLINEKYIRYENWINGSECLAFEIIKSMNDQNSLVIAINDSLIFCKLSNLSLHNFSKVNNE